MTNFHCNDRPEADALCQPGISGHGRSALYGIFESISPITHQITMKHCHFIRFVSLLALMLAPISCATQAHLRKGMTEAELRQTFGNPIRTSSNANGSKELYYNFESRNRTPWTEHAEAKTDYRGDVVERNAGWVTGWVTETDQKAVYVSKAGKVIGIPDGEIVRSTR